MSSPRHISLRAQSIKSDGKIMTTKLERMIKVRTASPAYKRSNTHAPLDTLFSIICQKMRGGSSQCSCLTAIILKRAAGDGLK